MRLCSPAKIEDGLYGVNGVYGSESDGEFMVTFDFGPEVYPQFLAELPEDTRERVRAALSRQPYEHIFPPDAAPMMTLVGDIGDKVYTNNDESYQPFIAEEFKCASLAFGSCGRGAPSEASIHVVEVKTKRVLTLPGSEGLWSPRWSPDGPRSRRDQSIWRRPPREPVLMRFN